MSKTIINATDVRNDFFKLIDSVARNKKPIYIKKDRGIKVKLEPAEDDINKEWEETKKWLDKTRGMWANRTEEEIRGPFKRADEASTRKIRSRNR